MSHANISVFVPHLGCPNRCSFCDQNSITGQVFIPHKADVDAAVLTAVKTKGYSAKDTELAFFGGSFTAIDRDYMLELLKAAYNYVKSGDIKGIRISTRPDFIDDEVLSVLKQYGVTAIELGAQSMCDDVLIVNFRGHTAKDVENASKLIKEFGFELGLQMMTGLYKSDERKDLLTAEKIIKIKPDTVRIYPTITLKNTYLEKLFLSGEYTPPSVEDSTLLCAKLIKLFENEGINIIRVGLHTIDEESYVAGPWHPSFKEMCEAEIYFDILKSALTKKGNYVIRVAEGEISKVIGQKKKNIKRFEELGYMIRVVAEKGLKPRQLIPERMNDSCF